MVIKDITITDFKSIYGTQKFDFTKLQGLVKLSGPIGSGKTTLAEAILWGLYGTVRGQTNGQLIAWNQKNMQIELNLISKNKEVYIRRNIAEQLVVEINGRTLNASNKRSTQAILEEEIYDVPKLAVVKMCVISFNQFNSLADMNPGETKQFLDEIFGFKMFSEINDQVVIEKKEIINELAKLNAIHTEHLNQIENLTKKKEEQQRQISNSMDLEKYQKDRAALVEEGKTVKAKQTEIDDKYKAEELEINGRKMQHYTQKTEYAALGRQEKAWVNTFKTGKCPTCGHDIEESVVNEHKDKMYEYGDLYKKEEAQEMEIMKELQAKQVEHANALEVYTTKIAEIKDKIHTIDAEVAKYNNAVKLISENYDTLIKEHQEQADKIKADIDKKDIDVGEWTDMGELFSKTLRYNLLDTLIPHINRSIQYFINKLDQSYKIEYDQEFKPHIFVESFDKEIAYNNLSTGQRKSLDIAIIFGVLQNVISSVNFNVFVLDELFSNMDTDTRNIMLELLQETMDADKSIFVINHAEMNDDYFKHKIRVRIEPKTITTKKAGTISVKCSHYEQIF